MYRTYNKLFRVRPEITTLGTGTKVIRLPKEFWITADVGIITFALLPIIRFTIIPLLSIILGIHKLGAALENPINWTLALAVSFFIGIYLRRFDPDGKSVIRWVWDYSRYFFRPKWSDGWTKCRYVRREFIDFSIHTKVYSTHKNICCSFPAEGNAKKFALYKQANISINRKGKIKFSDGSSFSPGIYSIQDKKIIRIGDLKKRKEGKV